MHWYAVHTKPHQENVAGVNLERLGIETFCPRLKQNRVIRRKRQTVIGPLFPGYLFARFDVETRYRAVTYAQGVIKVVTCGSVPAVVSEEIINSIKLRLQDGYVSIPPPSFTPGQVVRIQDGPLQGLEAVFVEEMNDHQRVMLLLRTLSYQASVVVDREHVVNL